MSKIFKNLNKKELSWVLYDVGNSAYTLLACALIPIWYKSLAIGNGSGQISSDKATAYYSLAISIMTVISAFIGPVCGIIADRRGMKKIMFSGSVVLGVAACILTGFAPSWMFFIVIYVVTKILYNASLVFYDSMINDITTDERMDQVSSYGFAWGYLGSCVPFLAALAAYICGPDMLGLISNRTSMIIGFTVTGIWWLAVTIPLMKNYKQINYTEGEKIRIFDGIISIFRTIKKIATKDKKVGLFLIAFFLYIDGVGTIIDNCINIGTDLNLNAAGQVIFLLFTQIVACIGSLIFGRLSKKYDTINLIYVCIAGYFVVCDDICRYDADTAEQEIIMLQNAIQKTGRSIVLSLSPGPALPEKAWIYEKYANMWRITDDLWDKWEDILNMFNRCEIWQEHVGTGCYPDCYFLGRCSIKN